MDSNAALAGLQFDVLAPEETIGVVGFVSTPDPAVHWVLRGEGVRDAVLNVTSSKDHNWTGSARVSVSGTSAYHSARFSAVGIAGLQQDRVYNWWIAVTLANGATAELGSFVRFVPFPAGQSPAAVCGSDAVCSAERLAGENYWYDALAKLAPDGVPPVEPRARALWNQLMSDVGLSKLPAN